jgi:PAS domain S-box-containing protein
MMRVLLIDDELDLAEVTKEFLQKGDTMQVSLAGSAFEGLDLLRTAKYDAIVCDYQMPKMDGLQLLKKLRLEGNRIPFILFTGKGREEVVIEALNSGADFYLQKGGQPAAQFAELSHKIRQATHARQAEIAMLESEKRYRELVENAFEGVWTMNEDGITTYVNQRMAEMLHRRPEEMMGRPVTDFFFEDDLAQHNDRLRRSQAHGNIKFEQALRRADGARVHCLVSTLPAIDEKGRFRGGVAVFMDMTESRRSVDAVRERQQKLDSLFEAAPVGMGFVKDRIYLEVNRRTEEMTGYRADELVGKSTRMLYESDEEFDRVGREKYGALDRTGIGTTRTKWRRKDGTLLPIQLTSAAIVPGDRSKGVCFIAIELPTE